VPPQLHAPDMQACPDAHAPQAVPPVPHAVASCFAARTQVVPWQHPPAHEVVVQPQVPLAPQACPEAQPAQAPPPVPHWLAVWEA